MASTKSKWKYFPYNAPEALILRGTRRCVTVRKKKIKTSNQTERSSWLWKSYFSSNILTLWILGITTSSIVFPTLAAASVSASENVDALTSEALSELLNPVAKFVAVAFSIIISSIKYIVDHPAIVTAFAAWFATRTALESIKTTRSITRLKETFSLLERSNWDRDVIKARIVFSRIIEDCKENPQKIAIYAYQFSNPNKLDGELYLRAREMHEEHSGLLRSILNANENMALGVKNGIIDEDYLFKAMKTNMLREWRSLSPLVFAYRDKLSNNLAFIEFEGLVNAWENGSTYSKAKSVSETKKNIQFD